MPTKNKKNVLTNQILTEIIRTTPGFLAYKNVDGVFEIVSEEIDSLFQKRFDTIIGKSIDEVYSKKTSNKIFELDQTVMDAKTPVHAVFEIETDDGTIKVDSIRKPIFDENGEVMGIVSVLEDISDKQVLIKRMKDNAKLQRVIIDTAKSFVNVNYNNFNRIMDESLQNFGQAIGADRAYIFEYNFNENTMNNTHEWCNEGISPEIDNLQDLSITDFLDGWVNQHREKKYVLITDVEQLNESSNLYQILEPQGIKSLITLPIFIDNECYGFFGFDAVKETHRWDQVIDLFELVPEMYSSLIQQHDALYELQFAQLQAEKATNIQTEFVAKVTHELRTPINGISNALYLLKDTNIDEDQKQYLDIVSYSTEVLANMVNNILDYSKIEKDKLQFKSTNINLENEVVKLMRVHKYLAKNKGLGLYLNYDYSLPTIISADIEKLRQILNNLIVNAIKYTNYGHIELRVKPVHIKEPYIDIQFEIIDTGIGISEEDQKHIFEGFYQVGDSLNKLPQGTGLGLTITKEFVEFLKGKISLESTLRKGSNFSFTLKFYMPMKETHQPLSNRALLVDLSDNEHSNIASLLRNIYDQVDICKETTLRNQLREQYDILFVYTNNVETYPNKIARIEMIIKRLREKSKRVLIYDDIKRSEYVDTFALFDVTLEAPIEREDFIQHVTSNKVQRKLNTSTNSPKENQKHRVLLVDDNNINRRVMSELLKGMMLDITEAKDGYEAIEIVKKEHFSIILMDILMPGLDGFETTRRIRELEGTSGSIPIIAVTANDAQTTKDKAIEYGMNGVLEKPLKKDELEQLLNEYFSNVVNKAKEIGEDEPIFDQNEFEIFYEEPFLRQEILQTFLSEKKDDLNRITSAFQAKDTTKIYEALHYLKGSFSYLKAKRILHTAKHIMTLSKQDKLNEVLLLEEPLLKQYASLIETLNQYIKTL
jgi:signal transduction histidine kinase/CheY-like chemotaxis protein